MQYQYLPNPNEHTRLDMNKFVSEPNNFFNAGVMDSCSTPTISTQNGLYDGNQGTCYVADEYLKVRDGECRYIFDGSFTERQTPFFSFNLRDA